MINIDAWQTGKWKTIANTSSNNWSTHDRWCAFLKGQKWRSTLINHQISGPCSFFPEGMLSQDTLSLHKFLKEFDLGRFQNQHDGSPKKKRPAPGRPGRAVFSHQVYWANRTWSRWGQRSFDWLAIHTLVHIELSRVNCLKKSMNIAAINCH